MTKGILGCLIHKIRIRSSFGTFFEKWQVVLKNLFFILLLSPLSFSQNYFNEHFGGSIGIVASFGTHTNKVGLSFNAFWTDFFVQTNINSQLSFNFNHLGNRKKFWEMRNSAGIMLLGGKKETMIDFQMNGLNHQTKYNYAVGFNYILYTDNVGTSQRSGAFGVHIKDFSIIHENDVFGGQAFDRYRTAQVLFSYRYLDYKFGVGIELWTGKTRNAPFYPMRNNKMRGGYKDLENMKYGKTSHGILYGSVIYNLPYQQNVFVKAGIDSEQIRHAVQNRFIHDLIFLPKKVKHNSPHYPRLDKDGCPVFKKERIRPNRLYLQLGSNEF